MPFPTTQAEMFDAGYEYARDIHCPQCGLGVEAWTTPGKREIIMDPMVSSEAPAVRHYETCEITPNAQPDSPSKIKLYGVNDPNRQLIAVGWSDGVLVCQWVKGKGQHAGVPEDLYLELRRVPFAYKTYQNKIKGKFPYTKME